MEFSRLDEEQVERLMARLRSGWTWSNGLVGHLSLRYEDGMYVRESQDLREPQYGPWVTSYSEDEFKAYMLACLLPNFVYNRLVQRLDE